MHELIWLVPALPLLGVLINGLLGRRLSPRAVSVVGCGVVGAAALAALELVAELASLPPHARVLRQSLYTWIASGSLRAEVALLVDPLSAVMMLVVTGVGFLIHVYSVGYMHRERGYARYFTYLNLFTFSMLLLVLADNFLLLYVGWEGVGLCSYLLIGFWYERDAAANAGKKAFITTRVGDVGFAVGIFLVFVTFGTVNLREVFDAAGRLPVGDPTLTAITLLLFLGAVGKSAQLPLHVWLPDAMEGPTPVSALIHAATMVTAGVYLVARLSLLYALAPVSLGVVAAVGGGTAVFAASIGLTQHDLKRVLAYSTISQLGYMFLALGVGAFSAGIFHLVTHAFFKALLFLAAGSVMHALQGELDMRRMGGLRARLQTTHFTFVIGALALAGIPPFAGFFSKDEILWQAFARGRWGLWLLGSLGAGLTAFYTFRVIFLTFYGPSRVPAAVEPHVHEAPGIMTRPLVALAILATVGGLVGVPFIPQGHRLEEFLEPVFREATVRVETVAGEPLHSAGAEALLMLLSLAVAGAGIGLAYWGYVRRPMLARRWGEALPWLYRLLLRKYYVDEIYGAVLIQPLVWGSRLLWRIFDDLFIDGLVNGTAGLIGLGARVIRRIQTGYAQNYALSIALGAVAIVVYFVLR